MKTTIKIILLFIAFLLIRGSINATEQTEFLYLAATICFVGLLIILATNSNLFKNEKNTL